MPKSVVEHMESENFRGTVRYVAEYSPFYKRKFAELGIDAKKILVHTEA